MFSIGHIFAERYELIKQLGRGGFSEVWLARDVKTNVNVAIKIYAAAGSLDENSCDIFMKEFALVFDMNHTNLLHPTFFDSSEGMPFLILPYCKNGSAFKYVTSPEHISEEEAWKMIHDVADGLAYLHGKQPAIIHQDIKPDNILINDEGNYMITDFGISTRIRSTMRRNQSQDTGGTLAYMGPERFGPTPLPIMASDIWSFGAMMYEVITGYPPFGEHGGVLQKNGADMPLLPESFSPEIRQLVYSCMALNTWDRPNAKQIADYAYKHINGLPATLSFTLDPYARDMHEIEAEEAKQKSEKEEKEAEAKKSIEVTEAQEDTKNAKEEKDQKKEENQKNNSKNKKLELNGEQGVKLDIKNESKKKDSKKADKKREDKKETKEVESKKETNKSVDPNKAKGLSSLNGKTGSNGKVIIIAVLGVIALVIGSITLFSGGEEEEPQEEIIIPEKVYQDASYRKYIVEGDKLKLTADTTFTHQAPDDSVEFIYFKALERYNEAVNNPSEVSSEFLKEVKSKKDQVNALLNDSVIPFLQEKEQIFRDLDEKELANVFQHRIDSIKSVIKR